MQQQPLFSNLSNLPLLTRAQSRSITPENPTGQKAGGDRTIPPAGTAGDVAEHLGQGWKVNPFINIKLGQTVTLADIQDSGKIAHIWMTPTGIWRNLILRIYWDDQSHPAVECPIGDFFANGWQTYSTISSIPVCIAPASGLNCFWPMPFKKRCKITLENRNDFDVMLYYQIDYELAEMPENIGYFHAHFSQSHPVKTGDVHTLIRDIKGWGQYVGTYICWETKHTGWWGEGEVKFYIDNDDQHPTICGTGTEDYFLGSYNFDPLVCFKAQAERNEKLRGYQTFSAPYAGMPQFIDTIKQGENELFDANQADDLQCKNEPGQVVNRTEKSKEVGPNYKPNQRFGLYRWHIMDPIRFQENLCATIQSLGWQPADKGRGLFSLTNDEKGVKYLQREDYVSSVAYWYQNLKR